MASKTDDSLFFESFPLHKNPRNILFYDRKHMKVSYITLSNAIKSDHWPTQTQ